MLHRAGFLFPVSNVAIFLWPAACPGHDGDASVLRILTERPTELKLPSRVDSIDRAVSAVADFARRSGFSEDALFAIDMAVREAVTNAVLHGNRQDESKTVEVNYSCSSTELSISVRDRGTGFDPVRVADPTAEQNLLKASGRGMLFMRNFMDDVQWERHPAGGTVVRMTKRK